MSLTINTDVLTAVRERSVFVKGLGKSKVFNLAGSDDMLIDAYAPVAGGGDYRRIRFRAAQVDYTYEIDKELSGIVLKNGVAIPVALGFDALNAKIYEPDMTQAALDLTRVTGEAVGEVQALRLSKEFNPSARAEEDDGVPLEIIAFAHEQKSDRHFRRLKFSEKDISYFEPHVTRQNTETFISLKREIDGWTKFYVAMPLNHFTYYLNEAKKSGQKVLDIAELTRPKKTSDLKLD